ncbi:Lipopolysaccharide assembly protein B [Thalassocella blandensis]|nr:Lipopolysaccharide assembly protein B [Thalassocella blandensis]
MEMVIFLLLFVAVVLGFAVGVWRERNKYIGVNSKHPADQVWNRKHYLQGLNYLLDNKTDDAIDAFISAMEVNAETLETHLALGKVLRRRGELAGAVKIHENLLEKARLSRPEQHIVKLELAKDYLHSGLLDRAEILLKELIDVNLMDLRQRHEALERLLEVYRDMHEWVQAIDIADRLTEAKFAPNPDRWRVMQAQFCCELAEHHHQDPMARLKWIRNALRYDPNCVRASFMQADMEMQEGNITAAIASVKCVVQQNPHFIDEVLVPLQRFYSSTDISTDSNVQNSADDSSSASLRADLELLFAAHPSFFTLSALFTLIEHKEGVKPALLQLQHALPLVESFYQNQGIVANQAVRKCCTTQQLVKALLTKGNCDEDLLSVLQRLLEWPIEYKCRSCGFVGEQLHWLCPSCKHWATITRM